MRTGAGDAAPRRTRPSCCIGRPDRRLAPGAAEIVVPAARTTALECGEPVVLGPPTRHPQEFCVERGRDQFPGWEVQLGGLGDQGRFGEGRRPPAWRRAGPSCPDPSRSPGGPQAPGREGEPLGPSSGQDSRIGHALQGARTPALSSRAAKKCCANLALLLCTQPRVLPSAGRGLEALSRIRSPVRRRDQRRNIMRGLLTPPRQELSAARP